MGRLELPVGCCRDTDENDQGAVRVPINADCDQWGGIK
jgi:hypothetical protein